MGSGMAATAFEKVTGRAQSILSSQTEPSSPTTELSRSLCTEVSGQPCPGHAPGFPRCLPVPGIRKTEKETLIQGGAAHSTRHSIDSLPILHPVA